MNDVYITLIVLVLIIVGVVFLGWIEEHDMKELNQAFFDMNMCDPMCVMEYFCLVTTKPMWRVGLMCSVLLALVVMALYTFSKDINQWLFFLIVWGIAWIIMVAYISYYSFHVLTPNGGQDNWNKYRYACTKCPSKFGGKHNGGK